MSEELQKKVEAWINTAGFGLELRSARTFRQHEFQVVQSDYYRDPKTAELREIDLVVHDGVPNSQEAATVVIVAECKRVVDKPWVVLSAAHTLDPELGVRHRAATGRADQYLAPLSAKEALWKTELFGLPQPIGFGLVTASLDSKEHEASGDRAYKALYGVTAAARAKVVEIQERLSEAVAIAWPLIILEGMLFQAWLNEAGDLVVGRIEQGVVAWRNPRLAINSFVTVVTEAGLPSLVTALRQDASSFSKMASDLMMARRP